MTWKQLASDYGWYVGILAASHLLIATYRKWRWRHWDFAAKAKRTYGVRYLCGNCGQKQRGQVGSGQRLYMSKHTCRKCGMAVRLTRDGSYGAWDSTIEKPA